MDLILQECIPGVITECLQWVEAPHSPVPRQARGPRRICHGAAVPCGAFRCPARRRWRRGACARVILHREVYVGSSVRKCPQSTSELWCGARQGFPLPSAAQVAARLRRFAARLSAEDVLPNSKAYVVAALFPDEASAAAAAAHLKGAADAMFAAAKVPVHAALRVAEAGDGSQARWSSLGKVMHAMWRKTSPGRTNAAASLCTCLLYGRCYEALCR